jgi:PAS domain S-box-containing protein
MNFNPSLNEDKTNSLFKARYQAECSRVNRFMIWLMAAQWFVGIGFASFFSSLTWIGERYEIHVHVWAAIVLGGAISGFAILWARTFPKASHTRHVIAISQVLWSALLIHLSGGRIETHFHVFASLAILSIYRDWKVLMTATFVVALDHFVRGVFYPLSAFGIVTESPYRWIEHAAWVLFEVSFLAPGCVMLRNEIMELCVRQTQIEDAKKTVDERVKKRTSELSSANESLASKTMEAEKLALVAKYTDNAVIITNGDAEIEWVNAGFERITGYSEEESIGKRPVDLLNGPNTDPKQIEAMEAAIKNKQPYDFEMLRYRKNGEAFWMAIEARPIQNENESRTQFILVESDITARVDAELERQKLNEQLVEASRAAGIAEVATGVLHNVGNVLNSVNVSASVIEKRMRKSALEKLQRVATLIEENAENFGAFVSDDSRGQRIPDYIVKVTDALHDERLRVTHEFSDLLNNIEHIKEIVAVQQDMAKSTGLQQSVTVGDVVEDALVANKGTLINHDIQIELDISSELPEFVTDKRKVLQILINLISNAKDAMVQANATDRGIEISASQVDDSIQIDVKDSGPGIANENLSRIFQHGFTTKKTGHGFGLHSSANAATELGGSLVAFSKGIGQGAMFRLTLPFSNPEVQDRRKQKIDQIKNPQAISVT